MGGDNSKNDEKKNTERIDNFINNKNIQVNNDSKFDDINLSIILVGESGQGKSKFCNFIAKEDLFHVGDSIHSETLDIHIEKIQREKTFITIIDTPGFNDTENNDDKYKKVIFNYLKKNEIDNIILTLNFRNPRFSIKNQELLKELVQLYGNKMLHSHLSIIYTNFEDNPDNEDKNKLLIVSKSIFEKIKICLEYKIEDNIVLPIYFVNSKLKGPKADNFQNIVNEMIKQIKMNKKKIGSLVFTSKAEKIEKAGYITALTGGLLCAVSGIGMLLFPPSATILFPSLIASGTICSGGLITGIGGTIAKQ